MAFSCGTEENTVDLNLGAEKYPLHLRMRTLGAKLESTSSSSAIAEDQVSELDFLNSRNTQVQMDAFTVYISMTSKIILYFRKRKLQCQNPGKHIPI